MELDELLASAGAVGRLATLGLDLVRCFAVRKRGDDRAAHRQLLGREESGCGGAVLQVMKEDGLEILLNTEATRVRKDGTRSELSVRTAEDEQTLSGTHLLVAVGRTHTEDLNLPAAE